MFSESKEVSGFLTHPKFVLQDEEESADILWLYAHFKDFRFVIIFTILIYNLSVLRNHAIKCQVSPVLGDDETLPKVFLPPLCSSIASCFFISQIEAIKRWFAFRPVSALVFSGHWLRLLIK